MARSLGHPCSTISAISSEDVVALRERLVAIDEALAGCGRDRCLYVVRKLGAAYPNIRRMGETEWAVLEDQYAELLADLPEWALDAARCKVLRSCAFFPSIAEIRSAAEEAMSRVMEERKTVKALIFIAEMEDRDDG